MPPAVKAALLSHMERAKFCGTAGAATDASLSRGGSGGSVAPQRDGATEERRMGGQVWAKRGGSEPHFGFDSYRKNYVGRLPLMIVVF